MRMLNPDSFERARNYLIHQARPLERALFHHRFEDSGTEGVLTPLRTFQNSDGGFGRALEPDLRSPSSSVLATAIGLRMLSKLDCPADEPLAQLAVAYLMDTFDEENGTWKVGPADVNSYPHAPWWHDEDGSLERTFDGFHIIPRALVLAGLYHYSSLVSIEWLERVTEETIEYIESVPELGSGGGSDLEYAIALAETRDLPQRWVQRLENRIRDVIPKVVVGDPARWNSYCLTPLRAIRTPETIGATWLPIWCRNILTTRLIIRAQMELGTRPGRGLGHIPKTGLKQGWNGAACLRWSYWFR